MALPIDDDLFKSPEMAKLVLLLLDSASIPLQSDSVGGKGLTDAGPLATVGGLVLFTPTLFPGVPLPRLLPGGLVIMAVTEAGMDNPVVWFI